MTRDEAKEIALATLADVCAKGSHVAERSIAAQILLQWSVDEIERENRHKVTETK